MTATVNGKIRGPSTETADVSGLICRPPTKKMTPSPALTRPAVTSFDLVNVRNIGQPLDRAGVTQALLDLRVRVIEVGVQIATDEIERLPLVALG